MARNLRIQSLINSISASEDNRMTEILSALNDETKDLTKTVQDLQKLVAQLQERINGQNTQ